MSTTIDSLSIEIRSNSTGAAQGIDALASSLGKLKANGTISVAVKNLNNLTVALKNMTSASSNASKISSLADAMAKLKSVGSTGSGVKKMAESLRSLGSVDHASLARVADSSALFDRIGSSLGKLSAVKTGGFSSMVNSLAKIGDVTDRLDDGTIGRFTDRIKALTKAMEPLSTKMTTVQAGLRGVNSSAKNASTGVTKLGKDVNVTTLNIASLVTAVQGAIAVLMPVVRLLSYTVSEAMEWDGVMARFGRGFGSQAEETYAWIQRLNEEMGINIQQFMQYSSIFSTMLQGFGVGIEDSAKMALGYTELTYDIWAGYNDVYKNFADAAEAVKSAIAGEVEPIRRAGFTIVESTLEQTAANHGLNISLEKATEAQKSYLRYLTLVDQAHAQSLVGTYAKEMNTAEGVMRTFAQQLKSLAQAFGSLFLPILVKVMPWLQAFVDLLTDAIFAVANFFGVEIQKIDWSSGVADMGAAAGDAASNLGDATKAAKDLQKATLGIDELNIISPSSGSSGSGAGAGGQSGFDGLDVDSLWDESIFDSVQFQVDKIKEKIKDMLPVIGIVSAGLAGWKLATLLTDLDDVAKKLKNMSPTIKNLGTTLAIAAITVTVGKLVWDFTGAYLEGGNEADLMKAIGTTALGASLAAFLAGKLGAGVVLTTSGIITLTKLALEIKDGNIELTDPEALLTGFTGILETVIGAVFAWSVVGPAIKAAFGKMVAAVSAWFAKAGASTVIAEIGAGLAAIPVWGWIAAAVVALVGSAVALAVTDYDFTDIGHKIGEALGKGIKAVWNFVKEYGQPIIDGLVAAFNWCKENINWTNIKSFLGAVFKKETWTEIIWPKVKSVGVEIWNGLWGGLKDGAKNLWGNITEFVNGFIDGFKKGFGIKSPSKKMIEIGKELLAGLLQPLSVNGIRDRIKTMWENAKSWWSGKKNLEVAKVSISLVKSGWSSVKSWVGSIPSLSQSIKLAKSGWSSVSKWIGNLPKISQSVGLVKSGWTSVKNWIGTVPSLSAKIKLLKDGWSSVKSWLGGLDFKLNFKLPKIGVTWGEKTVLGFEISYPNGFYTYAKGGFPEMGEMFIAREAGPEMVGKIGSRTTVANNEQIVEGISEGVYAAVLAAMRASESNGNRAVNVYLDGKQITASVEKRQRERGATVMGNQVFSY